MQERKGSNRALPPGYSSRQPHASGAFRVRQFEAHSSSRTASTSFTSAAAASQHCEARQPVPGPEIKPPPHCMPHGPPHLSDAQLELGNFVRSPGSRETCVAVSTALIGGTRGRAARARRARGVARTRSCGVAAVVVHAVAAGFAGVGKSTATSDECRLGSRIAHSVVVDAGNAAAARGDQQRRKHRSNLEQPGPRAPEQGAANAAGFEHGYGRTKRNALLRKLL